MHVLYLTCPQCGHTGMTRSAKAIEPHKAARRFRLKSTKCNHAGTSDQFKATLSYCVDVNPYRQSEKVEE